MNLRAVRFALPVALACLTVLPACHKTPVEALGPLSISLAYNQGQCTQNGATGTIDVAQNQTVTYVPASAGTPFNIQFSTCPFAAGKCPVNSPQGTASRHGGANRCNSRIPPTITAASPSTTSPVTMAQGRSGCMSNRGRCNLGSRREASKLRILLQIAEVGSIANDGTRVTCVSGFLEIRKRLGGFIEVMVDDGCSE